MARSGFLAIAVIAVILAVQEGTWITKIKYFQFCVCVSVSVFLKQNQSWDKKI